ncbi:MAG: LacI family DNA-binding transcriptional regulator [Clostridia bacterium]|nr:LacI family DNA-binding transcriptional regulator [Clostridia bacterium]MBQ4576083.1 LacI family DNA-binding transcriptional regulator [Clostridia bacterium]
MQKERMTIHDIAKLAGVSASAVSIVLNDRPGVSDATRSHIKKIIRSNNYTPNLNSRKLILNKSFNIFIVADHRAGEGAFDDMFYNSAIMGALSRCGEVGYNLVLCDILQEYASSTLKQAVDQHNVDGVIFLQNIRAEVAEELTRAAMPFVVLDSHKQKSGYPCICCDYADASAKAVSYLIKTGHKQIAFIGNSSVHEFYISTFNGYMGALEKHGIPCCPSLATSAEVNFESINQAIGRLLKSEIKPDAIFCAADLMAIFAMQSLAMRGISIPEQISVCAVDNILPSQLSVPPLTTVDIAKNRMGTEAVDMLMDMIEGKNDINFRRCIPTGEVLVRNTVINRS